MIRCYRLLTSLLLPLVLVVCGCEPEAVEEPTEQVISIAGTTTKIAVPKGSDFPVHWDVVLEEWKLQNETQTEIIEYDPETLLEKLDSEKNDWNIVLFPTEKLFELGAADQLATIPDESLQADYLNWDNFFRGIRTNLSQLNQKPVMIPISAPVLVCYYRADLLEKSNLEPPETWTDYQNLLESKTDWAGDLTVVEPWGPSSRATMFLSRAASYVQQTGFFSVFLDSFSGEPKMDSAEFLKSLQIAQAALKLMPEEVASYSPAKCRQEILEGRAALAIGWEHDSKVNTEIDRQEEIRIGICPLPGADELYDRNENNWNEIKLPNQAHLVGSSGLGAAVLNHSDELHLAACWSLANFLLGQNFETSFPAKEVSPLKYSDMDNPARWIGAGLTVGEGVQYLQAVTESLDSETVLVDMPLLKRNELRQILEQELGRFLKQETTPEETLKNVNQAWSELLKPLDQKEVLNVYRRTLGMPLK